MSEASDTKVQVSALQSAGESPDSWCPAGGPIRLGMVKVLNITAQMDLPGAGPLTETESVEKARHA